MDQLRIVTAYTPSYRELATRLINSCRELTLDITAIAYPDQGSWQANNAYKPKALLEAMALTGDHCYWLDADMYLTAPPVIPASDAHVLVYYAKEPEAQVYDFKLGINMPNRLGKRTPWGGHVLFRRIESTRALLTLWRDICIEEGYHTNDEQCLMRALELCPWARIDPLPDPYTYLVHTPAGKAHGKPTAAEGWL